MGPGQPALIRISTGRAISTAGQATYPRRLCASGTPAAKIPRRALRSRGSLNGVYGGCGGPDHVEHEFGLGEHRNVAALKLMGSGARTLCYEALQLGMDGALCTFLSRHRTQTGGGSLGSARAYLDATSDKSGWIVQEPWACCCYSEAPSERPTRTPLRLRTALLEGTRRLRRTLDGDAFCG